MSAKELTSLILDEERLRVERRDRKSWKSRVTGIDEFERESREVPRPKRREGATKEEDDLEYRLAIEASKNEAEEEAKRRAGATKTNAEDDDLAKAIKLSKEEEELRRRELEEANANSLFDDTPAAQPAAVQPTGWNQGYQQQPTVDWFGNVIDPQQQQNTGFGMQQTGYQNGYPGFQQQPTGYNAGFMQPQQTAFNMNNNPYGQQQNGFGGFGQQQQQQQQVQPQDAGLQPGSNNPWAATQSQQDGLKPQPTGSNNPFASSFNRPLSAQAQRNPTLSTLQEQKAQTSFNPIMNFQSPQQQQPVQQPIQQPQQQQASKPLDPHHARLNALLSSGEGQDTFGNVGDLRIPAQHTAPGTFVNSAGAGMNKLTQNATGHNPFLQSQYTGMPQASYQQSPLGPAQTGPAGSFGASYGPNNPFGQNSRGNQQPGQGNLIEF